MDNIKQTLIALHQDEDGATATEYVILLVLVACFIIGVVAAFGEELESTFTEGQDAVSDVGVTGVEGGADSWDGGGSGS